MKTYVDDLELIEALREGDDDAAEQLWACYSQDLLRVARHRLGRAPRGVVDEEDVVVSAFTCMLDGVAKGRFPELSSRNELWGLLLRITSQKAIDWQRRCSAKKRDARRESRHPQDELQSIAAAGPTPEFVVVFDELMQQLLDDLASVRHSHKLRDVASLILEGHSNREISVALGICLRTVERKRARLRQIWADRLQP